MPFLIAYEPFGDSVPGRRQRQHDANRSQREDSKRTTPDIRCVDATPREQVVNRAGQYECKAQKKHGPWMIAKVRDALYRRRKQPCDDSQHHQALVGLTVAAEEKAPTNEDGESEYISKAYQKEGIGRRCTMSKQPGLECHSGTWRHHCDRQRCPRVPQPPVNLGPIRRNQDSLTNKKWHPERKDRSVKMQKRR